MMDLAQFNADDTAFVQSIEDQTDDAMKINDPIERFQALHKIIEGNRWDRTDDRKDQIKDIYERADKKALNIAGTVGGVFLVVFSAVAGSLIWGPGAAYLCLMLGGLVGGACGVFFLSSVLTKGVERVRDDAEEALENVQNKVNISFKPAIAERNHLFDNDPQVKEYFAIKDKALTDAEIKALVNEKFRPKTVTPDDLTVTLPATAAKPRIRLKGFKSHVF